MKFYAVQLFVCRLDSKVNHSCFPLLVQFNIIIGSINETDLQTSFYFNENKLRFTKNMVTKRAEEFADISEILHRQLIGKLIYVMIGSTFDIAFAVSNLSKFISNYEEDHWKAAKEVVRYLRDIIYLGPVYNRRSVLSLRNATDMTHLTTDIETKRSLLGFLVLFNVQVVFWFCKQKHTVSLSTSETRYFALCSASLPPSFTPIFSNVQSL